MCLIANIRSTLRSNYDRTISIASHKYASLILFVVAFAESSFFPLPPHAILIPMVLAKRTHAWKFAAIATIASVLGGLIGYLVGYTFFDKIGKYVLDIYDVAEKFDTFRNNYNYYGAWIVFFAGVTPFPYKVVTIASGAMQLNLVVFLVASLVSRGLVFFSICCLLYIYGQSIRGFMERRLGFVTAVFLTLIFAGLFLLNIGFFKTMFEF
ncbi:MAG: hypothetical protein TECD_00173 [Hyphomicrobiaceae bacterium hypho_1]